MPALGLSLFLIAVGAVLAFAISTTTATTATNGIDLQAVGWILMGVGALGILMTMLFLMSFSPFGRHDSRSNVDVP
jgi:hypothetical protein